MKSTHIGWSVDSDVLFQQLIAGRVRFDGHNVPSLSHFTTQEESIDPNVCADLNHSATLQWKTHIKNLFLVEFMGSPIIEQIAKKS